MDRGRLRAYRDELRERQRNVGAIAVAYGGVLVALVVSLRMSGPSADLFAYALMVGAGTLALPLLGRDAFRLSLARPPEPRHLISGGVTAVLLLAIGLAYALVLYGIAATQGDGPTEPLGLEWHWPSATVILTFVLLPALVEEWLCRGVLWCACRRLTGTRQTILLTAAHFGLMHVLSWGPFGFPSRFLGGLVLGRLRARSGSLAPCVMAHFLNNRVAAGFL